MPDIKLGISVSEASNADHYFRGDACKWTGEAEEHYNGLFYVYTVIEGHLAGQRVLSGKKPLTLRSK